ncbi:hypothetical protein ASD64_17605 [Mesorhizobium sp. Root157]|nr:hypothetical protein ASD64_17605 [Mesorhizobium sp. Root157]
MVHAYRIAPDWGGRNSDRSIDVIEAEEKERVIRAAEHELTEIVASAIHGSVAEQLLNTLPCGVLAVPTRK